MNSRCDTAIKVAMEDNDVVAVVVERINYGDMVLNDVYCLPWSDPHGFHFVYFDFDCAPGVYCLWDPGVLVLVDVRRRLVKVVDEWYVPGQRFAGRRAADTESRQEHGRRSGGWRPGASR